jgi:isoleucyl-tRNA synthetase
MTKKSYYPAPEQNFDFAQNEEEILNFWKENKIFEKSIQNRDFSNLEDEEDSTTPKGCCTKSQCSHQKEENNEFVFYDGPPFANGLPHYGHLLTGFIKDIFARYQTMKGKKVERKFGWDTHGLPVEMETEKALGVSGQIAIKEHGIKEFNDSCKESVMKYASDWKNYVQKQGRWVDFENGYKTMDVNYMESVLWAFKELHNKGLMYEDLRVVPYSWACQTPLSNFETRMDNSYRRKESKAVTVKFELEEIPEFLKEFNQKKVFLLAWTTTPWTLPSNLALAINDKTTYQATMHGETTHIVSMECSNSGKYPGLSLVAKKPKEESDKINFQLSGKNLVGLKYKPLFPYLENHEKVKDKPNCFTILHGDFVTTDEGTGIVHIAPGFGEDDQLLCKENGIPTLCPVDEAGKFTSEIFDLEESNSKKDV